MYAGPMPRRVVPISLPPRRCSLAPSRSRWYGMIRCALAADEQAVRRQAVGLEAVHLLEQHLGVDDARRCR